ncbi:hypothetical protein EZV62_021240 [Acer yangbiense]|uniref:tRNA (adenine(58)-N(1))-methyltransferase non-catalytic subunit TRM6 n=1 Tax=Acer yangbiense TaxID=1000413 RepID=A0A5C7H540_9ROSI|nr:hypothetical protein EZV62_021240 [Acer yangbiense]
MVTSAQTNSHEDVCNMEIQSNVSHFSLFLAEVLFCSSVIYLEDLSVQDQISSYVVMEDISISSENVVSDIVPETTLSPASKFCKAPNAGEKASQEALKLWKENGFSSLIMAAPEIDPWNLVKDLLRLLSYSAPFAPLVTCMHNLQTGKMAIGLQISEPWLREYQVLPSRTHPCMQMSGFGGYILSGTRISSS